MKPFLRRAIALGGLTILLVLAWPGGTVRAYHDGTAGDCYNCHDLNGINVEPGTHLISVSAMVEFKGKGWVPGVRLGCTFCHRSVNASYGIKDVLSSFSGATPYGASRHPVARNFVTGSIDNVPYFSTDNTVFAQHLDCRDCHDISLVSYPNHDNGWLASSYAGQPQKNRSTNPFALKGVTNRKAYDGLCRSCHVSAASFQAFTGKSGAGAQRLVLQSHDNGSTGFPIRDLDNTNLKTQVQADAGRQCAICHDAHESQNEHLFSDGHEYDWNGIPDNVISELADCTNVCHDRGDYDQHGHGKALAWDNISLGYDCDLCHNPSQPHRPGDNNYFNRYRFAPFDTSWLAPSKFGKPRQSICARCHTKPTHGTDNAVVGCIDCHDQHAKSSGSNVMMIRNTNRVAGALIGLTGGPGYSVGSESVLFAKSAKYNVDGSYHYFTDTVYGVGDNANAGFCDQRACHGGASKGGVPLQPLSVFLPSGKHSGGDNVTVNSNCEGCHGHNDIGGSFRAQSACTNCHGQPPPPPDTSPGDYYLYNEYVSPHRRHAANVVASRYYNFDCRVCHQHYTDKPWHDSTPSKTFQSVFFDNAYSRGAAAAYDNATMACSNITCHSDGRGGAPNVALPQWFNPSQPLVRQTLTCDGCHNSVMTTGAHTRHLDISITCSSCHVGTSSDCNAALNATSGLLYHVNGTRDVLIKTAYDSDGNPANNWVPDNVGGGTCTDVTCHGGNPIPWLPGALRCESCHSYTRGIPVAVNVYSYAKDNVMSKVSLANFTSRGHGDNSGLPWDNTSVPAKSCETCHDLNVQHDNALNPFRLQSVVNGRTVAFDNISGFCTACHTDYLTRSREHSRAVTGGGQLDWTHTQRCVDCHDPHGVNNIYMVYDNLAVRGDNSWTSSNGYGIPADPANRSAVTFATDASGSGFASTTLDGNYTDGICEACHSRTEQFQNTAANGKAGPGGHPTRACTDCHTHATGFAGIGGNNIEQFFDNAYRAASATDYNDLSGHPLRSGTSSSGLFDNAQGDCYVCHGVSGTTYKANECLKCHFEKRTSGTPYHPNGQFEWATVGAPGTQYGAAGLATDAFCQQCHTPGVSGPAYQLGGVNPINVIPSGEGWTTGSGHGSTVALSNDVTVGPPAYSCRDCHSSTVGLATSPVARDRNAPTFHGSVNRKMVANTDNTLHEYPHPADNDASYNTVDERSGQMDWYCGTRCHGNAANGIPRDDNVVKHTWNKLGGFSQQNDQTHPSNMRPTPDARFRAPDNLPLSEYLSGGKPGTGNEICVTCHNPHGGGDIVDKSLVPQTGGNKQMMRRSWADNGSTICKECHL